MIATRGLGRQGTAAVSPALSGCGTWLTRVPGAGSASGRAQTGGAGPDATMDMDEYLRRFHSIAAPPAARLAARLTPAMRRRQEEEILMLCQLAAQD